MANIKSVAKEIVFQEVPSEISLCLYISNCQHHCKGCHSPWLSEDIGEDVEINLHEWIESEFGIISCVLFMGGDNGDNLIRCLEICKEHGLKTALYSGCTASEFDAKYLPYLDYVKIGPYNEYLGGLKSRKTNQRLFKVNGNYLTDITSKFWNNGEPM